MTTNWKLIYIDDGIMDAGFYWRNAGDPPTYSPASEQSVADELAALRTRVAELEAALNQMLSHFGLTDEEMRGYNGMWNKNAVKAIKAARAALLATKEQ